MDWVVIGLSAVLGFATLFAATYTQNWIIGIVVLGIGTFVLFGAVAASGGPAPIIEEFVATVGIGGLFAAVVGGVIGGYAGDRYRSTP
jgi:hypothetical protein